MIVFSIENSLKASETYFDVVEVIKAEKEFEIDADILTKINENALKSMIKVNF